MNTRRGVFILCTIIVLGIGGFFYVRHVEKWTHTFHVVFLDVGQGDASLINFKNGEQMLVDCGKDRLVLSRLGKELAVWDRTIDYLLVTHPDLDHYGGCIDILRRYEVKHIITNGRAKSDAYWQEFEKASQSEGAELISITNPTVWNIASTTLEFISPDLNLNLNLKPDDSNNYSIVFRLVHGNTKILFTADAETPLEKAFIERYCAKAGDNPCGALAADILKVGHHGSDSSSLESFIRAVSPKRAIISVGKNSYGHPSLRVLRRFDRTRVEVLRTDKEGAILVK